MVVEESADYAVVEKAIQYLETHYLDQPSLTEVAGAVGMSDYHFQRLFSRWAGISPKRFVQYLTIQHAKQQLAASKSLLETTYDVGLSSPGRLHDLFVTHEAMTPGEYKSQGVGLDIQYGFQPTPFGPCLVGLTDRGLCHLAFVSGRDKQTMLAELSQAWSLATLVKDEEAVQPIVAHIFCQKPADKPLRLLLKGTNFQVRVWQALLRIPPGALVSYGTVAALTGKPKASRAVGTAVGLNPVAYLIPCHRVIQQVGEFGNYRWGTTRKKAIIGWEAAHI